MKKRLNTIKIVFFILVLFVVLRLGYWQIVLGDELSAKAENQRVTTRELEARRGEILFSDNQILASTEPSFLVYVQPNLLVQKYAKDPKMLEIYKRDFADKVAQVFWEEDQKQKPVLDLLTKDASESSQAALVAADPVLAEAQKKAEIEIIKNKIYEALGKNLYWVSLGKNVDISVKNRLEKMDLLGLGFQNATTRVYPEGSSSAHLLGFVGSDDYGIKTGYYGLEGNYNGELKGKPGVLTQERDAMGLPILIGEFIDKDATDGKKLVLNIDRAVQKIVEEKLRKGMEKYKAKGGSVVILEPNSGRVIAMASMPSYDPAYAVFYPKETYRNPITSDGYEPGSTFKVLVMAAAINEGLVTPQTTCDICSEPINMGGFTIKTWDNKYRPNQTMTDTIIHSDNTGMVFTGKKLGLQKMIEYIKRFGFDNITGIDLQDERSPDLRPEKDWKEIDLATSTFGQGISVTAIQLVRAVASIANGGFLMEPQIVSEIKDKDTDVKIQPRIVGQPITKETAEQVKNMMVAAVDEGESKFAKPKGYRIAGKTGTAQIPIAGHYDANKTIASFVGFAPAENPKFVMLVRYDSPATSIYGSETAAPTFFDIAKELFLYYGIPPQEEIAK